jgi:hypothetical protein
MEYKDNFLEKLSYFEAIRVSYGFTSCWSIYEVWCGNRIHQPHPFPNAVELVYNDVSAPICGKSWLDLWAAADKCILTSNDLHHVYIERFSKSRGQPGVLILTTGS